MHKILPNQQSSAWYQSTQRNSIFFSSVTRYFSKFGRRRAVQLRSLSTVKLESIDISAKKQPAIAETPKKSFSVKFLELFIGSQADSHLLALDTLRGLAVAFVVIYHIWRFSNSIPLPMQAQIGSVNIQIFWDKFISGMGDGVDIFFVLSGFLLSLPWHKAYYAHKPKPSVSVYFRRRFIRIVPPFWFMLTLILLFWTNNHIAWNIVAGGRQILDIVATYLFMHQLFPETSSLWGVNGAMWTLTIEMIFYIVLPLLVRAFIGKRWIFGLAISGVISFLYLYLAKYSLQPLFQFYSSSVAQYHVPAANIRMFMGHQFPSVLVEFGIGMTLANYYVYRETHPHTPLVQLLDKQLYAGIASIAGIILLVYSLYTTEFTSSNTLLYLTNSFTAAMAAALLIFGSFHASQFAQSIYGFLPLRFIGVIGYSVFLWHFPIVQDMSQFPVFSQYKGIMFYQIFTLSVLPVILLISILMFFIAEKPCIDYRISSGAKTPKKSAKNVSPTNEIKYNQPNQQTSSAETGGFMPVPQPQEPIALHRLHTNKLTVVSGNTLKSPDLDETADLDTNSMRYLRNLHNLSQDDIPEQDTKKYSAYPKGRSQC